MKSNVIVIIACEKLCKGLRYLGQLEYENGSKVDYVGFYLCGAGNKDDIAVFMENLVHKDEYSESQKDGVHKLLNFIKGNVADPINEDFKLFITRHMYKLEFNSWKCMPELMASDRYLVLPVTQETEPFTQIR